MTLTTEYLLRRDPYPSETFDLPLERESEPGESSLASPNVLSAFGLGLAPVDTGRIELAAREILAAAGEDLTREGLVNTPHRVAKAFDELLSGYRTDPVALVNNALFDTPYDDPVIVHDIEFYSLCEHHLLPFWGHAHVAYIPNGKIIGLSKIPRIVDMFARRLQVQENLTRQIAEFIQEVLDPQGVCVVVEGTHLCAVMRGVQKHDAGMMTTTALGVYRQDAALRGEFMRYLNH